MEFGTEVRKARQARQYTLKHVAERVHKENGEPISLQFLNDIELGRRLPSPAVVQQLAKVLKLDPIYLRALANQPISDRPASSYPSEKLMRAIRAYKDELGE